MDRDELRLRVVVDLPGLAVGQGDRDLEAFRMKTSPSGVVARELRRTRRGRRNGGVVRVLRGPVRCAAACTDEQGGDDQAEAIRDFALHHKSKSRVAPGLAFLRPASS